MKSADLQQLADDLVTAVTNGATRIAIIGWTSTAVHLLGEMRALGLLGYVLGVYDTGEPRTIREPLDFELHPLEHLRGVEADVIVIASDEDKEEMLIRAAEVVGGSPRVLLSGFGHFSYRNDQFEAVQSSLLVPSLANGYPNSLIHIYQCLSNAARIGLRGVVVEFGMFKGGTTMFIARAIKALRQDWKVIGFDTFSGFPAKRSVLDMYDHPDCVYYDKPSVEQYLRGWDVEIVEGDIVETSSRIEDEDVVLAFVDTDNYTPAAAAIEILRRRVMVGGAIVFDHWSGIDRFLYTLGERIAARSLLDDAAFLNLHGTGVFLRQRS